MGLNLEGYVGWIVIMLMMTQEFKKVRRDRESKEVKKPAGEGREKCHFFHVISVLSPTLILDKREWYLSQQASFLVSFSSKEE